ncbi:MAG: AAA family ATPase, partial [Candidatus Omnitrophica bacterium]|nr:AAA family ATPase [Candidatus Omnitrophota bacterium]
LIEEVCGIKCGLKDMSPIAVERGFTEKYISRPDKKTITKQIQNSFRRVSKNHDMVIVEGTGHAGVGSVFDHSNASVAKLVGAKAIIISSGGIGRPIDEIMLNKALFEREGVKLLGVIINKVLPDKFEKINNLVRKGLERKGVPVLGVIPYNPMLSRPTIEQILEETDFEFICGKDYLECPITQVIVGAMEPHDAIKYIVDDSLIITPGDREDMLMTALGCFRETDEKRLKVSGIILSGGIMPDQPILNLLNKANVPVLLSKSDTYDVATRVHDLTVKIRPKDADKVNAVVKLIKDNVDLEKILKGI